MRVAMYYNNMDIKLEEIPIPEISPDELLLKVLASGICGSDVMEWYRIKKAPLVLGHEVTGEIVAVGEKVNNYKIGDRVFVSHHVPCNTCRYCLSGHHTVCETLHNTNFYPGGFAEYIRVPQINVDRGVFLLPEEISFEEGVFIEPLACVIRAQRLSNIQPGYSVLIIGSGISGLLHLLVARTLGAGRVITTDINEYRINTARQLGADAVIHAKDNVPARLRDINEKRLADLVVICTGAPSAFAQAFKSVDKGGTVLFFAPTEPGIDISIPINEFWRNGIRLIPSYGGSPLDITMAIELIRTHSISVNKMITHRLGFADIGLGFKIVIDAKESIKVIVKPHS